MRATWHVAPTVERDITVGVRMRSSISIIVRSSTPCSRRDVRTSAGPPAKLTLYPTVWTIDAPRGTETNQIGIKVADFSFLASADIFFQTTRALLRPFVEHVIAAAAPC